MPRDRLFAKDWPKERDLFVRKVYDRKDKVTKRPGKTHIIMKFPRQELIEELTGHVRTWLQTRSIMLIVLRQTGGQDEE